MKYFILSLGLILTISSNGFTQTMDTTIEEIAAEHGTMPPVATTLAIPAEEPIIGAGDKYTLGPDDIVEILVRRHANFSGKYIINKDGKIQYKFVGDINADGLTKDELKEKITELLSEYIVEPDIDVAIVGYRSKVFYVIGEVARPGKYYMMDNTIPVREAIVAAGLPTMSAAMRKCRLTRPSENEKPTYTTVNVYEILYGGDLRHNIDMQPGDVLYVPATIMAKAMRVIAPVSAPISTAVSTGRTVYAPLP